MVINRKMGEDWREVFFKTIFGSLEGVDRKGYKDEQKEKRGEDISYFFFFFFGCFIDIPTLVWL